MLNISMDAINIINYKLSQADAITTLLMCDCDSDMSINDELRADVLGAISDLISDSKKLFRSEVEREEENNNPLRGIK